MWCITARSKALSVSTSTASRLLWTGGHGVLCFLTGSSSAVKSHKRNTPIWICKNWDHRKISEMLCQQKISLLVWYYSNSDISLQFSINIEIDNKCSNKKLKWRFLWKHLYCRVLWNKGQEGSKVIPPTQKPLLLHGNCSRKVKTLASIYFWWNCHFVTHNPDMKHHLWPKNCKL